VITHPAFAVEPWCIRETVFDLDVSTQSEWVSALSNGHIGWRGNCNEGEPHGLPDSSLNGYLEACPLPYAEAGYPEGGQTVINVTDGKRICLRADEEMNLSPEPDVVVTFGITGDLAHAMTHQALNPVRSSRLCGLSPFGVATDNWSQEQLLHATLGGDRSCCRR
jgi:trehalose/maltose hydrolase-like predicted phosphorylase